MEGTRGSGLGRVSPLLQPYVLLGWRFGRGRLGHAAPNDQAGSCALERPSQAWTMLGGCWAQAHSAVRFTWKTEPLGC